MKTLNKKEKSSSAPIYILGTDTLDENSNSYCLKMLIGSENIIIMAKTIRNREEFLEEVNNVSKYFNARILETEH